MGTSRPFVSENKDINKLVQWVIRHFAPINNAYGTSLREMSSGKSGSRDSLQRNDEIRYRKYEDQHGKFLQPVIMVDNLDYPLPAIKAGNGQIRFLDKATVWDDLQVPISALRLGGAAPADAEAYKDSIVLSFDDGADEWIYFTAQLPHSYQQGSDIEFHIHWTPKVNGAGVGAENVKWDFTYSWANIGDSFPASSPLTVTTDVQDVSADEHILSEVGDLAGTNKRMSSMLLCSLKRDTAVANNYTDEAYVVAIDFHFKKDTIGSDLELDK